MATLRSLAGRARWWAQRALPRSMRTVPSGVAPCTRDVVSAEQYAEVDPAHTIVREMPRTIDAAVDPEFTNRRTFDSPATFVVTLPRGRVLHHAVLTRDGVLLADLSIEPNVVSANANEHSMLYRRSIPTITNVDGELVVLAAFGGADNYFHWMFDVLPRIETMTRAGHPITERTRVLIDGTRHPFQRETLAQLGIETLVDASAHPFVRADMLVVPSLPGIMGDVTAASCEFLRRSFLRGETATPKRIYVSRDGAANRRLLNEADVIARLAPLGFDVVRAETLSFHEQVALFSSAEVVIAPHGAGLTNIVFCGAGARVVELFSPSYVNGCYWGVAHQMNLDYWYLLGDGMRPEYDETHRGGADDFRVDLAKLDKLLERAGIS